ncbi:CBS domain containing-hemolysin-like protein [Saccharothrix tamanrassetensis]|uniref:CBS domain containing-hemolysin-like protein n=1 Tax=Saccharothrix tamanrassetensis TaxID=1051531 RepID=A0A841CQQ5_9PSEU|nr:hemolysin family protein [Saccharothrix tamanrassetensis]MBB5959550.1 CBS domain containing-hemolysin-like protein [Saccharothrix tamanrassetensis]
MLIATGLLAIVALTVATGYFVAQEFAYMAADRGRLRQLAESGDQAAERALRVTRQLSFMLSGAQFGITVTALLAGYVAEPLLGTGLAGVLGPTGLPQAVALPLSMALALVFATVVQMVLGELLPKNFAIARPESLAKALSASTLAYLKVAGPVIRLFDAAANRLLRAVGIEPVEELPQGATPEDLRQIIGDASSEGHLDPELSHLLERGLGFRELAAEQAMTPRVAVHAVRADEPAARVVALLDTGHSRFPVFGDDLDDLRGVVGLAEVLTVAPEQRATTPIGDIASPALVVPTTLALPAVLERLRTERRQLACVVDEFGGFAGVVSLEDLAEELVGEIHDEDDLDEDSIESLGSGRWLVPGRMRVDEIADTTGVALPAHDSYDTVSGLVLHRLGRTARVDDEVAFDGVSVRVTAVARNVPAGVVLTVVDREDAR